MSLIYNFTSAILDVMRAHRGCVEAYGDKYRIVSFYPATEDRDDVQLNFADGSCLVIYPDYSIDGYGPSSDPEGDLAKMGEPIPWPFDWFNEYEEVWV